MDDYGRARVSRLRTRSAGDAASLEPAQEQQDYGHDHQHRGHPQEEAQRFDGQAHYEEDYGDGHKSHY